MQERCNSSITACAQIWEICNFPPVNFSSRATTVMRRKALWPTPHTQRQATLIRSGTDFILRYPSPFFNLSLGPGIPSPSRMKLTSSSMLSATPKNANQKLTLISTTHVECQKPGGDSFPDVRRRGNKTVSASTARRGSISSASTKARPP